MQRTTLIILFTLISTMLMAQTHLYRGNSSYSSDILYTWDGKSLYRGNSSYSSDILYTFDGKHVYRGRSSYSSDILYSFDGPLPLPVLLMTIQ